MSRCSPEIPNMPWVYRLCLGVSIAVLFSMLFAESIGSKHQLTNEVKPLGFNNYEMLTGDVSDADRQHWDKLYKRHSYIFGKEASLFLKQNVEMLPTTGRALDLAMGEGRNAVFLAKRGFAVDGVDISAVALRKAQRLARENHTSFRTFNEDLTTYQIRPEFYDVILNIDYLQRSLIPQIKRGLKHHGVVVFESDSMAPGELKELFKDFQILVYRDGNLKSALIARRP